jgi:hypothetical protein
MDQQEWERRRCERAEELLRLGVPHNHKGRWRGSGPKMIEYLDAELPATGDPIACRTPLCDEVEPPPIVNPYCEEPFRGVIRGWAHQAMASSDREQG